MKKEGEQVTKVEVYSDQVIGSNEHKSEVVKPNMCTEKLTGSDECTDGIIDSQRKCEC